MCKVDNIHILRLRISLMGDFHWEIRICELFVFHASCPISLKMSHTNLHVYHSCSRVAIPLEMYKEPI